MTRISFLTLLWFSFVSAPLWGENWKVYVASYKHDKACAITYTFDDGLIEHYTLVAPELEKRGFRGTFFINGSKVTDGKQIKDKTKPRVSWAQLKAMAANGHEISNHGWAHRNVTKHSLEEIKADVLKNDSAIYANVGVIPRTYAYPGNRKGGEAMTFIIQNRVGTRMEQRSLGSKRTPQDLEKWVRTLLKEGDWGVTMTHGITYGYDAFVHPEILWEHWDKVKKLENKIWVGTFREVAAYLKEKEAVQLEIAQSGNELCIRPQLPLDKKLFTEPLTLVIEGCGIKKMVVRQDRKKIPVVLLADKAYFDFNPHGGEIRVKIR